MPPSTSDTADAKIALWERHGQTLMLFVITGALAFTGNALVEAKTAAAATAVELKSMSANLARLEGAVTSMQSQYITRAEFAVHEQRLQAIELHRGRK